MLDTIFKVSDVLFYSSQLSLKVLFITLHVKNDSWIFIKKYWYLKWLVKICLRVQKWNTLTFVACGRKKCSWKNSNVVNKLFCLFIQSNAFISLVIYTLLYDLFIWSHRYMQSVFVFKIDVYLVNCVS